MKSRFFTGKENSIKNIKLPVSAPFHCSLMNKATNIMSDELNKLNFTQGKNKLISRGENIPNKKSIKFTEKQMPKQDVLTLKFFYNSEEYNFTSNPLLSKENFFLI